MTMRAEDVTDTLEMPLMASRCDQANMLHKLRVLSGNDPSYVASDLADRHKNRKMFHPQTQGKIERWRQTLKNRILVGNYYLLRGLQNCTAGPHWRFSTRRKTCMETDQAQLTSDCAQQTGSWCTINIFGILTV